jgi:predicted secreted Zn-dependent protease
VTRVRLRHHAVLLALALAAPVPAAAQRGVYEEVRYRWFAVEGATAAELNRSIDAVGAHPDAPGFAGYTHTTLNWTFRTRPHEHGCGLTDVRVRLDAEVSLPRWDPPAAAAPALRAAWDAMAAGLRVHEEGHVEIARDAARAIHDTLAAFTAPTCDGIDAAANAAATRENARAVTRGRDYDRETGHGRTQGAVRPTDPAPLAGDAGEPRRRRTLLWMALAGVAAALFVAVRRR